MAHGRSELLDQAIARLSGLVREEQDRAAIEILANLCSEEEWVLVVASEPYQQWLAAQSEELNAGPGRSEAHLATQVCTSDCNRA
jgi:hypothetical protein